MPNTNCEACTNLRDYAPEFAVNGVTTAVCESLHHDTGFNPNLTVLHENEPDLHDANDCLIGNLSAEIDAYDVCDWKEFMKKLLPNLYETMKAVICSEGGVWDQLDNICSMIDLNMAMALMTATHVNSNNIGAKFESLPGTPPEDFGIKLRLNEKQATTCAGTSRTYGIYGFYISSHWQTNAALVVGDVIAKWTKAELVPTYMSEAFWNKFLQNPYSNTFCYVNNETLIGGILTKDSDDNGCTLKVETVVGDPTAVGRIQTIHSPLQVQRVS